ncbi:MAG: helix-turn-helix transcriptional regulator [Burkholderiales bacterium]|nr:helix-turn-helix transcriptional regulator [Burkholderiales bacterium]
MSEPLGIDGLAARFYEAALEPDRWKEGLEALVAFAGVRGASFSFADLARPANAMMQTVGQPAEAVEAYHRHYQQLDPLLKLGPRLLAVEWISDWEVLGPEYGKSDYYNEFMRPFDNHAVLVSAVWREGTDAALVALQRSHSQGAFPRRPGDQLAALIPHLRRAARLHFSVAHLRAAADIASEALHRVGVPLLVVEANGRVVIANAAAQHLCGASKLLRVRHHQLVAVYQDAVLQQAIRDAAAPGRTRPAWLRLGSTAGEDALLLVVAPLAATSPYNASWQRPLVVIMASRNGSSGRQVDAVLAGLFGLTAAEARVASSVAHGLSPAEIAERYGVAVQTVRKQLKAIYSKMGVRRQSELSSLLARLNTILPPS